MNEKEIKRIEEELKNEEIKAYNRVVDYVKQADEFLKSTDTEFKVEFLKHGKHFGDDDTERDIYLITLKRGNREFKFNFGQSEAESGFILYHDKEKMKRTRHKPFKIPAGVREQYHKEQDKFKKSLIIKRWFEPSCVNGYKGAGFSLCGLSYDVGVVPSPYDVLAGLTTTNPLTFEDFCSDYGYDTDSRKAKRVYKAVVNEFMNLQALYNEEELNMLAEIC